MSRRVGASSRSGGEVGSNVLEISCQDCQAKVGTTENIWFTIGISYYVPWKSSFPDFQGLAVSGLIRKASTKTFGVGTSLQDVVCKSCNQTLGLRCHIAPGHFLKTWVPLFKYYSPMVGAGGTLGTMELDSDQIVVILDRVTLASQKTGNIATPIVKDHSILREQPELQGHPKNKAQPPQKEDTQHQQLSESRFRASVEERNFKVEAIEDGLDMAVPIRRPEPIKHSNNRSAATAKRGKPTTVSRGPTSRYGDNGGRERTVVQKKKLSSSAQAATHNLEDAAASEGHVSDHSTEFDEWLADEIQTQRDDIFRISETMGKLETEMQTFRSFMTEIRRELSERPKISVSNQLDQDLSGLRQEFEEVRQELNENLSKGGRDDSKIFNLSIEAADTLTDNISKIGQKANEVDSIKLDIQLLKSRLNRLENMPPGSVCGSIKSAVEPIGGRASRATGMPIPLMNRWRHSTSDVLLGNASRGTPQPAKRKSFHDDQTNMTKGRQSETDWTNKRIRPSEVARTKSAGLNDLTDNRRKMPQPPLFDNENIDGDVAHKSNISVLSNQPHDSPPNNYDHGQTEQPRADNAMDNRSRDPEPEIYELLSSDNGSPEPICTEIGGRKSPAVAQQVKDLEESQEQQETTPAIAEHTTSSIRGSSTASNSRSGKSNRSSRQSRPPTENGAPGLPLVDENGIRLTMRGVPDKRFRYTFVPRWHNENVTSPTNGSSEPRNSRKSQRRSPRSAITPLGETSTNMPLPSVEHDSVVDNAEDASKEKIADLAARDHVVRRALELQL